MGKRAITVADGDGIGPEIMRATLYMLEHAGAELEIERVEIGERLYLSGHPTGIEERAWESLRRTKVFLKAPITTPQGGGYRSLNVSIRGRMGLYANVRPCASYAPFIETKHPKMDLVIIRENEEDLYTGIEYQQTPAVCTATKLISRPGTEKIVRYGFEYARHYGRKKVTCFTKDNILKMSDGLFHKVFEEMGAEYPELEKEHWIIDIGTAKLADTPEDFDLLILPNLYGDILSDITAQISGSVGLGGSANIGESGAMFEAIHGSAPKRAGQDVANPSGLLHGALLMLLHIQQAEVAERLHNAWLCTIEEGVHTRDIFKEGKSHKQVGTQEFAKEVVKRLGKRPKSLSAVSYKGAVHYRATPQPTKTPFTGRRELFGVDVTLYWERGVEELVKRIQVCKTAHLALELISNRGAKVWPEGFPETFCIDQWRCRFISQTPLSQEEIPHLLQKLHAAGADIVKTEFLFTFDGKKGYSTPT